MPSEKETSPWERDAKAVDENERALDRGGVRGDRRPPARVDYCKDRGLPTDGATLVFKRLTRAALETDRDLVVTTDPSGEAVAPFFALLTTPARVAT